jgi:hypothetical protein
MGFKFFQKDNNHDDEFERMLQIQFPNEGLPDAQALVRRDDVEDDEIAERNEVYEMLSRTHFAEGEIPQSETLRRYDPEGELPPAVFTNILRPRDSISDELWMNITRGQRMRLIELMWHQGMIMHTIVSQDDNGFTLRTEILF